MADTEYEHSLVDGLREMQSDFLKIAEDAVTNTVRVQWRERAQRCALAAGRIQEIEEAAKPCTHHSLVNVGESMQCYSCREYFGWWCPGSPDHVCHYESHEGKVTLIDGSEVDVPKNHDASNESDDWCIFCGNPEERK